MMHIAWKNVHCPGCDGCCGRIFSLSCTATWQVSRADPRTDMCNAMLYRPCTGQVVVHSVRLSNTGNVALANFVMESPAANVSCQEGLNYTTQEVGGVLECAVNYTVSVSQYSGGNLNQTLRVTAAAPGPNKTYDNVFQLPQPRVYAAPSLAAVIDTSSCAIPTQSGEFQNPGNHVHRRTHGTDLSNVLFSNA